MDKRISLAIAGVAVIAAVVWLTTQRGEPGTMGAQAPSADGSRSTSPPSTSDVGAKAAGADGMTTPAPKVSAESSAAVRSDAGMSSKRAGEALPIDVSPGFEFLKKPAAEMKDTDFMWSHWRRHQQLESEPRDEAWAPRMEAALRSGIQSALTAKGFDTQRIELPVVECRTNGCEIQAVGYAVDNMKDADLQSILPRVLNGALAGEFDMNAFSILLSSRLDDRIPFLVQLPRKKS
jgi:hypothetical protein